MTICIQSPDIMPSLFSRLSKLCEEIPAVLRRERCALSLVDLAGIVVAIVYDPGDWVPGLATLVFGQDRLAPIGLWLRGEALASIVGNELVAQLAAHLNVQNRVRGAMLAVKCDGVFPPLAAAQGRP